MNDPATAALAFLVQIANDFCASLPPSARVATTERAQMAIRDLETAVQDANKPSAEATSAP